MQSASLIGPQSAYCFAKCRVYPGLIQQAAAAHLVDGFVSRDPSIICGCLKLMKDLPVTADALVLKGICWVLLGKTDKAEEMFKQASR
jgi:hypothetical protein